MCRRGGEASTSGLKYDGRVKSITHIGKWTVGWFVEWALHGRPFLLEFFKTREQINV